MRRKAVSKGSPEKSSRRSSRRGRKSPTVSPEKDVADREEQNEEAEETLDEHKADNSESEREESGSQKKGKSRRNVKGRASEDSSLTKPRRSVRRKSQSVEPSEKEDSEKDENGVPEKETERDNVMETIPEEKSEEVHDTTALSNETEAHVKSETIVEQEQENGEKLDEPVLNIDTVVGEEAARSVENVRSDLWEQSRESGEVDSESIQDEESQPAAVTQNACSTLDSSKDISSSIQIQQSVQTPKPARKSRFRSRSRSPVVEDTNIEQHPKIIDDKNDEELEAGEIKDEPILKRSPEKKTAEEKPARKPLQRKRRWLSSKSDSKTTVITISTDSLKNIISEPVQPVPLSDVKLESSPEPEEIVDSNEDQPSKERRRSKDKQPSKSSEKENIDHGIQDETLKPKPSEQTALIRKISIVSDNGTNMVARPPSPARHHSSNILYITNLVRPFTVLQLKGLLARTGKIVENGFWIDKIKSKCYVKYETEDEAVETRHALHGVRWPTSNPKCLNVDFGTEGAMEKAIISTLDDTGSTRVTIDNSKDTKEFGWSRDMIKQENQDTHVSRPVREWDLGKKDAFEHDRERAEADRGGRDRDREREKERDRDRERDRSSRADEGRTDRSRRRSMDRDYGRDRDRRRNSASLSPARKFKKKENEPPIRLLDDLFRKTKTTPCIYWLPLTTEQIIEKDEQRRKNLAETQRRQEEARKHEEERRKERERRERERRERVRSNSRDRRRRSRSRDDGRRRHR